MSELTKILKTHAEKYPLMRPADAVKLIYQGEFGGGHLIRNACASLERIESEYEHTAHDSSSALFEDIGFGMVRLNFAALDIGALPLDELNRIFVLSSEMKHGSMELFLAKLDELCGSFGEIGFGFGKDELEGYIRDYKAAGCPVVSHSAEYRQAYKPAYRVILAELIGTEY